MSWKVDLRRFTNYGNTKTLIHMGLFWDLVQQSQIEDQKEQANSLEARVKQLEAELHKTQQLLIKTLEVLEKHTGKDIDGNGTVG